MGLSIPRMAYLLECDEVYVIGKEWVKVASGLSWLWKLLSLISCLILFFILFLESLRERSVGLGNVTSWSL